MMGFFFHELYFPPAVSADVVFFLALYQDIQRRKTPVTAYHTS